jgi:hypothetical protein
MELYDDEMEDYLRKRFVVKKHFGMTNPSQKIPLGPKKCLPSSWREAIKGNGIFGSHRYSIWRAKKCPNETVWSTSWPN